MGYTVLIFSLLARTLWMSWVILVSLGSWRCNLKSSSVVYSSSCVYTVSELWTLLINMWKGIYACTHITSLHVSIITNFTTQLSLDFTNKWHFPWLQVLQIIFPYTVYSGDHMTDTCGNVIPFLNIIKCLIRYDEMFSHHTVCSRQVTLCRPHNTLSTV